MWRNKSRCVPSGGNVTRPLNQLYVKDYNIILKNQIWILTMSEVTHYKKTRC